MRPSRAVLSSSVWGIQRSVEKFRLRGGIVLGMHKNHRLTDHYWVRHSKVHKVIWLKSTEKMNILTFIDYFYMA